MHSRRAVVLGSLLAPPLASQTSRIGAERFRKVDRLFAEFDKPDSPGYAVGVLREGSPVHQRGYGVANLECGSAITPSSVFNIASLSKQFTAACLALLVLDGKVSLEDEASRYIPALQKYPERIRIKHLVYMTSGLRDYYTLPRKNGRTWNPSDFFTVDDAIETSFTPAALAFRPGSAWSYSNVNYMLLARIVERVSGMAFPDFAEQRLFRPLGMAATHVNADLTMVVPNRALGYNRRTPEAVAERRREGLYARQGPRWMQFHRNSPHFGGSGVLSTLEDLGRWDRNFHTRAFGGDAFHALMHRRIRFDHPKDNDAFGLVFGSHNGMETVWYDGGDLGFSSSMIRFPGPGITVFVLSNLGTGEAGRYARLVADLVLG